MDMRGREREESTKEGDILRYRNEEEGEREEKLGKREDRETEAMGNGKSHTGDRFSLSPLFLLCHKFLQLR